MDHNPQSTHPSPHAVAHVLPVPFLTRACGLYSGVRVVPKLRNNVIKFQGSCSIFSPPLSSDWPTMTEYVGVIDLTRHPDRPSRANSWPHSNLLLWVGVSLHIHRAQKAAHSLKKKLRRRYDVGVEEAQDPL